MEASEKSEAVSLPLTGWLWEKPKPDPVAKFLRSMFFWPGLAMFVLCAIAFVLGLMRGDEPMWLVGMVGGLLGLLLMVLGEMSSLLKPAEPTARERFLDRFKTKAHGDIVLSRLGARLSEERFSRMGRADLERVAALSLSPELPSGADTGWLLSLLDDAAREDATSFRAAHDPRLLHAWETGLSRTETDEAIAAVARIRLVFNMARSSLPPGGRVPFLRAVHAVECDLERLLASPASADGPGFLSRLRSVLDWVEGEREEAGLAPPPSSGERSNPGAKGTRSGESAAMSALMRSDR